MDIVDQEYANGNMKQTKPTRAIVELIEQYVIHKENERKNSVAFQMVRAAEEYNRKNPHAPIPLPAMPSQRSQVPWQEQPLPAPGAGTLQGFQGSGLPFEDQGLRSNLSDHPEVILSMGGDMPKGAAAWAPYGTPAAQMPFWELTQTNLVQNPALLRAYNAVRKFQFDHDRLPPAVPDTAVDAALSRPAQMPMTERRPSPPVPPLPERAPWVPPGEPEREAKREKVLAEFEARRAAWGPQPAADDAARLQAAFDADPATDALFPKEGIFDGFGNKVG